MTKLTKEFIQTTMADPQMSEKFKAFVGEEHLQKFSVALASSVNKTPELAKCSTASFMQCALDSASVGLVPNTRMNHSYIIPYGNTATLQIGYQGFLHIASQSGIDIDSDFIAENDKIIRNIKDDTGHHLEYEVALGNRGNPIVFYARALINGKQYVELVDMDELEKIRKLSKNSGAWASFPNEMRRKVAIKRLAKHIMQHTNDDKLQLATDLDNESDYIKKDLSDPTEDIIDVEVVETSND